jgi:glycogen operon protein
MKRTVFGCSALIGLLAIGAGCGQHDRVAIPADTGPLGVYRSGADLCFRVYSARATHIELELFREPFGSGEVLSQVLARDGVGAGFTGCVASAVLGQAGLTAPYYYGYRAWGPNWPYQAGWTPGSMAGFRAHVDGAGNRFNPNKLLFDPYARELTHDPVGPRWMDVEAYATGNASASVDSGPMASKGIILPEPTEPTELGTKPERPLRDEIIYEVQVRGLTMNDPSVPAELRGTYRGAALKAAYLRDLGVTAIELLPVHETQNDQDDVSPKTANYWGYMTLNFFAPDRRYAADTSPGGPTREFQAMVKAMHDQGIKVYLDVVYNHTAEGAHAPKDPDRAYLFSLRGLDNSSYYELAADPKEYVDVTGTGANFNTAAEPVRRLILDSLHYWTTVMGVDGYRFDLAPVLGNSCLRGCFDYNRSDPQNALNRAVTELPVRPHEGGPGVDLVAEPWAAFMGYEVGHLPTGWSEWNDQFRDTFRKAQNEDATQIAPHELAARWSGSPDIYTPTGRPPQSSINFVDVHDGFTLRDAVSCGHGMNPWDHGGDQGGDPKLQLQAARNGFAFLMLSAGVPIFAGGDEMYRTLGCLENPYNLDTTANWLDWSNTQTYASFARFARALIRFRTEHPALRPAEFWSGTDHNGNGLADFTLYREDGTVPTPAYLNGTTGRFLGFRIDGSEVGDAAFSIYVGYARGAQPVVVRLPDVAADRRWTLAFDTAMEAPFAPGTGVGNSYPFAGRSVVVLVEERVASE